MCSDGPEAKQPFMTLQLPIITHYRLLTKVSFKARKPTAQVYQDVKQVEIQGQSSRQKSHDSFLERRVPEQPAALLSREPRSVLQDRSMWKTCGR